MRLLDKRAGLLAAAAAFATLAACSSTKPKDAGLDQDLAAATGGDGLELAPKAAPSQMVVSAIEGGPKAEPTPKAPERAPKPMPQPAKKVADLPAPIPQTPTPAPAHVPAPVAAPAPARVSAPAPVDDKNVAPIVLTPNGPGRQKGTYGSEGEVFRTRPWIKP